MQCTRHERHRNKAHIPVTETETITDTFPALLLAVTVKLVAATTATAVPEMVPPLEFNDKPVGSEGVTESEAVG